MMRKYNIILHCTKNYLENSLNLIESLGLFHDNLNFYLYTVNFSYNTNSENVKVIPYYSSEIQNDMSFVGNNNDTTNKNMFKSVFLKSKIVLHTLDNLKLKDSIYIDSDMIPTGDISLLFEFLNTVEDYPLIQESVYEYQINYGRGNPFHKGGFDETNILEYPLMDLHHVPIKNRTHYSVSSVMLYNQSCKQFLREYDWLNNKSFEMDLEDIKFYYPFSDETTLNVLLWKYEFKRRIQRSQMNVDNLKNIEEFYESNYTKEKEVTGYVRVPSKEDRNKILFFHGAKGDLSNWILDLQKNLFSVSLNLEENKIFISPKLDFDRDMEVVFVNSNLEIFYQQSSKFNKGLEFWYSPNKKFSEVRNFDVLIFDNNKLIFKVKY